MKRQFIKIVSILMALVCFTTCLVACGNKDVNISETNSSISIEDIYYDEESGEIIDSSTGNVVKDENLYVDKETGDIIDSSTGETIKTKEESQNTQQNSSNNTSSNTSKDDSSADTSTNVDSSKPSNTSPDKNNDKNNTNNSTNNNSSNSTPNTNNNNTNNNANNNNNNGNNNSTNNNNQGNTNTDFNITLPTSSKKVSFNRQKLYNEMIAIYEKPEYPTLIPVMTKGEYFHQINGTVPSEIQYLFDWYFAVYDKKGTESITCSAEHKDLFKSLLNDDIINAHVMSTKNNNNGFFTLSTTYDRISEELERKYFSYSHNPTVNNETAIDSYNYWMNIYNENCKYAEEMCDKIADALAKAGVKNGENEVTAINKIIKYICDNCEYSVYMAEEGDSLGCHIQDFFNFKEAVCDGYAKTFWAMCKYCNIDVEYHSGKTSDGYAHAWNSVKINNKDYYFDVTWHDIQLGSALKTAQRTWCSKSEFDKDHIRESSKVYYW